MYSLFIFIDSCQEFEVILTLWIFPFFLHKLSHLNAYFVVRPLSPDRMPSYDEKSDPFLFQSMFSLLIPVFVVLTDSVSLYAFWCIFHTLHGNWYKFNPCCFWILEEFQLLTVFSNTSEKCRNVWFDKPHQLTLTYYWLLLLNVYSLLWSQLMPAGNSMSCVQWKWQGRRDYTLKNEHDWQLIVPAVSTVLQFVDVYSWVTLGFIALLTLWPTDPGGP